MKYLAEIKLTQAANGMEAGRVLTIEAVHHYNEETFYCYRASNGKLPEVSSLVAEIVPGTERMVIEPVQGDAALTMDISAPAIGLLQRVADDPKILLARSGYPEQVADELVLRKGLIAHYGYIGWRLTPLGEVILALYRGEFKLTIQIPEGEK